MDDLYLEYACYDIVGEWSEMRTVLVPTAPSPIARLKKYRHCTRGREHYYKPDPERIEQARAMYRELETFVAALSGQVFLLLDRWNGECLVGILDYSDLDCNCAEDKDRFTDLLIQADYCGIYARDEGTLDIILKLEAYYELPIKCAPCPYHSE